MGDRIQQMQTHDQLGPLARAAVHEAVRDLDLPRLLRSYLLDHRSQDDEGIVSYPDVSTPNGDADLASFIRGLSAKTMGKPMPTDVNRGPATHWGDPR